MMEAKDTVMDEALAMSYFYKVSTSPKDPFGKDDGTLVGGNNLRFVRTPQLLEAQAEVSFKAGMKEVVEWIEENSFQPEYSERKSFNILKWQDKLNKWGIK